MDTKVQKKVFYFYVGFEATITGPVMSIYPFSCTRTAMEEHFHGSAEILYVSLRRHIPHHLLCSAEKDIPFNSHSKTCKAEKQECKTQGGILCKFLQLRN
jgi:hypothetical protein